MNYQSTGESIVNYQSTGESVDLEDNGQSVGSSAGSLCVPVPGGLSCRRMDGLRPHAGVQETGEFELEV